MSTADPPLGEVLEGELLGHPFFCYSQNNSGGSFHLDLARGISHYVLVQAPTAEDADARAAEIGLYFDGSGDCPCCGDRWSPAATSWGESGDPVPRVYDQDVTANSLVTGHEAGLMWIDGPEGFIHYADGRVAPFWDKAARPAAAARSRCALR